ncbi:MAG TPA: DUF5678 domain-containing protein [Blastocatellia bacterium]|nr:DUF5678 domain-containing protein [Blastocatellia bacterium]
MSTEELTALKDRLASLTLQEKSELAKFLSEQIESSSARCETNTNHSALKPGDSAPKRAEHMAWLKTHREEYAGKYVALDGERLVGSGPSIREAREQARQAGVDHPFLVHVSSVNDAPFGGW